MMGAKSAFNLLSQTGTEMAYIEQLRNQIKCRRGSDAEPWLEQIIRTAAQILVDIDETRRDISKNGRIWEEQGYNMQKKKVANPEMAHLKDLTRTLAIYYESLGLSFKSTPSKMKDAVSAKGDRDPLIDYLATIQNDMNDFNQSDEL